LFPRFHVLSTVPEYAAALQKGGELVAHRDTCPNRRFRAWFGSLFGGLSC
jgi:hypothetical protein